MCEEVFTNGRAVLECGIFTFYYKIIHWINPMMLCVLYSWIYVIYKIMRFFLQKRPQLGAWKTLVSKIPIPILSDL